MTATPDPAPRLIAVGTKVEVRTGFDGSWSQGFVVTEAGEDGYRLRRRSDGEVLPELLPSDAVRRERRDSLWWV